MKPIMWLYYFVLFLMTIMIYNMMNFYIFITNFNNSEIFLLNSSKLWKW